MKHALALLLLSCVLCAQDKPAASDPLEEAKNGKIAQDGRAFTKSYVDISMLALEQRKLWTQTLSRVMDLSK